MPKYYFDVYDGTEAAPDQIGTELGNDRSARQEATRTLSEIAAQELPNKGPFGHYRIIVRDADRKVLFQVELEFKTAEADELDDGLGEGIDAGN